MTSTAFQGLTVISATAGSVLAMFGILNSWLSWQRNASPCDFAIHVAAWIWLAHLLVTTTLHLGGHADLTGYTTQLGFQLLILAVSYFLLCASSLQRSKLALLLALQGVVGMAAVHWNQLGSGGPGPAYIAWLGVNLVSAVLLTLGVGLNAYRQRSVAGWLSFSGCILALGVSVDDVFVVAEPARIVMLSHHFYAAFLYLMWALLARIRPVDGTGFAETSGYLPISEFGTGPGSAASAVADERRRIAQDLHDGVGSQIVTILATLDAKAPQHRAMALALENCLLDLKMTVDAIDSSNDSVIDALGQLRFRVQHSLDKLQIRMAWRVEASSELEALRGERARQILRIAQEGLTNVMRHAEATTVEVICRFEPERGRMMLEIRDDGRGLPTRCAGFAGKGLTGMRQRAQTIGGKLLISSQAQAGTRVRLTVPRDTSDCPASRLASSTAPRS